MNNLIKKFLVFSVGPIGGAIIAFITVPLTTYFISPEEFGKSSMFVLFQTLIVTLLYLGMDQSYTREYHGYKDKQNLLRNAMFFPFILSFVFLIIICINVDYFSMFLYGNKKYEFATILFGLTIVFKVIERFILLSVRMEEKALEYSVVNILLKFNILIITMIYIFFIRRDFLAVVYATAIGQLVADFYLILRYRVFFKITNFILNKTLILNMLKFGLPLIIAASLTNFLNSLDRMALRLWSSFFEIGIFTAAIKISGTLSMIQASFTNFWIPVAYRWHSQNKDIKHFELVSNLILLIMSILYVVILLLKDVVVIILSNEYADAKYIIGLLCLQPILYTLSETTTLGIAFSKKSHLNVLVSFFSIIPNIVINIILVRDYGAVGAAVATGISYIFFFFFRSYYSNKNWTGFSIKRQVVIILLLFVMGIINSQDINSIQIINVIFLIIVVIMQIPTIKKLINVYKKENSDKWDFS